MGRDPYSDRLTVEQCKSISTKFLKQNQLLNGDVRLSGCAWKQTESIAFVVSTIEDDKYIRFVYIETDKKTTERTKCDYKAHLTWTPCHFGGRRWWFICPMEVDGEDCNRRVGVLYLPNDKSFGCRHCHNLTYRSCQESHQFDRFFREIDIDPKVGHQLFKK